MAADGPYRVGRHSPINVWFDPLRGKDTGEQVCMATSAHWAGRIVDALNAASTADSAELERT